MAEFTAVPETTVLHAAAKLLPPDERQRGERFRTSELRRRFFLTRLLTRQVLGRISGLPPAELRFSSGQSGKPCLSAPAASVLRFSIAHTETLLAILTAEGGEPGIDVEAIRPERDDLLMARRFFCPQEAEALAALDAARRPEAFTRLWCLKEAYLKALGVGLGGGLDSCCFALDEPRLVRSLHGPADAWRFELTRPTDATLLATALPRKGADSPSPLKTEWVTLDPDQH